MAASTGLCRICADGKADACFQDGVFIEAYAEMGCDAARVCAPCYVVDNGEDNDNDVPDQPPCSYDCGDMNLDTCSGFHPILLLLCFLSFFFLFVMGEHATRFQVLMSALVVIDFERRIQPGQCLDDCTIAVAQPYYTDMGCEFSLAGLEDVSRLMLSPFLLPSSHCSYESAPVRATSYPTKKNVEPCLDQDEQMKEESNGGLEGCASGSNFGNPCEVTFCVPVIPSCC
jgi:hypothetical protein